MGTLEQGVAGLSVGIASCGPGFNQAWYFDGDRIRNMMFYSDKCLAAVSNHFNVEMAPCDDSNAQKWTYKDGVLQMPSLAAMKANLSASLCAPILTTRSLLRTATAQVRWVISKIFTPTSYELPRWTES